MTTWNWPMLWLLVAFVCAVCFFCWLAMAKAKEHAADQVPTQAHKKRAWAEEDIHRYPPMSKPAAKGIQPRDPALMRDVVTRAERMRGKS